MFCSLCLGSRRGVVGVRVRATVCCVRPVFERVFVWLWDFNNNGVSESTLKYTRGVRVCVCVRVRCMCARMSARVVSVLCVCVHV